MITNEKAIETAKRLQEFCDGNKECDSCIFHNVAGYCEVDYPTSWDLDEIGDDKDV